MIKFFRKIRQHLLSENKPALPAGRFSKYMIYAIGEIILVVVGILIALQVNNLNEERKARAFELKILIDIKTSLDGNIWQLDNVIRCNTGTSASAKLILKRLEEDAPYHDSLGVHFSDAISWCIPALNNSGYESLKTYGLHTITNDSIRDALNIYEAGWIETLGQRQEDYFFNTASPMLTILFDRVAMRTSMKPIDYEALKTSKMYLNILRTNIAYREDQIRWYKEWKVQLQEIDRLIDAETMNKE